MAVALLLPLAAVATSYVVKRGDTLYSIAQRYGVPLKTLAERNGLSHNHHVYTGERLEIPTSAKSPGTVTSKATTLPASVQRGLDRAPVKPGCWKFIVIHHSGSEVGTVKSMDRYHREVRHMENGLAYHFVIGNGRGMKDGSVAVCHRWKKQLAGGHLASEAQNRIAIGICLVGNFDERRPTSKQMRSLRALVISLMRRCRLSLTSVKTHRQINVIGTRCPGMHFPMDSFLKSLREAQ
jgi:N-acetyl-anhydromuramyl-L-alanine amidase AmpD